jgi:hypothetical protein
VLNIYAAKFAADVLRKSDEGDPVGRQHVIEQLDAIVSGKWMMVPSDSSIKATEEARKALATVYLLLSRPDPTCAEYRGAIEGAKAYVEQCCPWINDYLR